MIERVEVCFAAEAVVKERIKNLIDCLIHPIDC